MSEITRRRFLICSAQVAGSVAFGGYASLIGADATMTFEEYRKHDALGLAALIRKKQISPRNLLDLAIARSNEVNPKLNALVVDDRNQALETLASGIPAGPFSGVPFLLKDLGVSMAGTKTTQGSRLFQNVVATKDDPFVRKVLDAGLVVFGKTHSSEFGNSPSAESATFGATRNPWNTDYSAGGSSGGAAAAVAAGIIPVAHGSDGGGSIRIPASACGLFGLKPSRGLVPVGLDGEGARGGLAAQHVISRSVRDSAAFLDALAWLNPGRHLEAKSGEGSFLKQVFRAPGKLRIAMMREPLAQTLVDPECIAAVEHAAALCRELGHEVEEAAPSIDTTELSKASGVISVVSLADKIRRREAELGRAVMESDIESGNWEMLAWGRQVPATDYLRSLERIRVAGREMASFMEKYDLILSPTIARMPPKVGSVVLSRPLEEFGPMAYRMAVFASLYNITGQPAMSVPLFWTEGNMPVGVMFAGRYGQDRMLYRVAAQLEKAKPWFARVPEV